MLRAQGLVVGQYLPGDSPVHRTDPRAKILVGLAFSMAIFAVDGWAGYAVIAALVLATAASGRVGPALLVRGLAPLWLFIALTAAMHAFLTAGQELWRFGPLAVTREGLAMAGFMAARLVLMLAGLSLITLTTSPVAMTDALEALLKPARRLGFPSHEVALMMTIALRFIPTLMLELDRISKAQMARGAAVDAGSLRRRIRHLGAILVPLFMGAFRRADDLATAMEARCYRGAEGRTRLRPLLMGAVDWAVLAGGLAGAIAVAWLL